jgi:TetR/AcrR family transcriptional repressor of nem operon
MAPRTTSSSPLEDKRRDATPNAREAILLSAKRMAQLHGYSGLTLRELAEEVGIKAASIYYHFPGKADLAVAVARRYWEDGAAALVEIAEESPGPIDALHRFPEIFRRSLEADNRLCLGSVMAAETDNLPAEVRSEIQRFADVNIAWLGALLVAAEVCEADAAEARARAVFAAVAGAQMLARGRSDIALFDSLIDSYRASGLLPA